MLHIVRLALDRFVPNSADKQSFNELPVLLAPEEEKSLKVNTRLIGKHHFENWFCITLNKRSPSRNFVVALVVGTWIDAYFRTSNRR